MLKKHDHIQWTALSHISHTTPWSRGRKTWGPLPTFSSVSQTPRQTTLSSTDSQLGEWLHADLSWRFLSCLGRCRLNFVDGRVSMCTLKGCRRYERFKSSLSIISPFSLVATPGPNARPLGHDHSYCAISGFGLIPSLLSKADRLALRNPSHGYIRTSSDLKVVPCHHLAIPIWPLYQ